MNTEEIKKVLKFISKVYYNKYNDKLTTYVCACDELANLRVDRLTECAIIMNTDPSTRPGAHWQAVWITYVDQIRKCYFFDSYGLPPKSKMIIDFIKFNSDETTWNNNQVQGFDSTCCGEYCCIFIWNMLNTHSFSNFYNIFNDTQSENDNRVGEMFCKLIVNEMKNEGCNQNCMSFNSCKEN